MEFLKVDSVDAARQKLLDSVKAGLVSKESVTPNQALGRVAAEDVFAPENIPAFRRSTVDGYAVLSADTAAAGESIPVFLTLAGRVEMGQPANLTLVGGQCAEVFTGGMLPDGANAVVMVEYTEEFGGQGLAISQSVAHGENVVLPGEDMKAGDLLLRKGKRILPQDIGALAAAGVNAVSVYAPTRATILSTGDELVAPEQTPTPGQVRNINTYALSALAKKHGLELVSTSVLPDDQNALEQAVRTAMQNSDIVIVSGGSSKGKKDMTRLVFDRLAVPGVYTHGIAIKPGKPTILGYDDASRTLLVGLPGHPVSAMMVFELLIGWLLREVMGAQPPPAIPARITCNVASAPGKLTCWPCRLSRTGSKYTAEPVFGKSGMITTLTQADGYFIAPPDAEGLREGGDVMVHLF
ncbi:MAG: molybdopterin molybdotransferase MoeA [Oscillospiraceae bacterium]|nr:molybdopterin molybdotransferase MoeA [Oscillospiraceae bacterium]